MAYEHNQIYQDLLNRIIEVEKDLYGKLAIRIASKVKELEISEKGKVMKIFGSPKDAIRNLVYEYEVLGGHLSKNFAEAIIKAYHKQYPNINLPEV